MKFLKKNQIIIAVIGLMLIAAGYLNFTNNSLVDASSVIETGTLTDSEEMAAIGDAQLVSTNPVEDSTNTINSNIDNKKDAETKEENKNNITENTIEQASSISTETSATITTDEYFTKSRLERETMYSQMLESYQKILENTNVSESQKATAQKEIKEINEEKNAIMIAENLIKTKGFDDLIIFINDKSINVIIKAKKLEKDQIAQIQNIITRELKAEINNIHISNKE